MLLTLDNVSRALGVAEARLIAIDDEMSRAPSYSIGSLYHEALIAEMAHLLGVVERLRVALCTITDAIETN